MNRATRVLSSYALLFLAAIPLWACGQTFEVEVDWVSNTKVKGKIQLDGEIKTFEGTVGNTGCVEWDIDGCSGRVCGQQPGTPFKVTCKDPLLMEWPDDWTLVSATWSAPAYGLGGILLSEPAAGFILPGEFGLLTTDPGSSAWLLHLDYPGPIGPGPFIFDLEFDVVDGSQMACLKAIDVALVDLAFGPDFIVPTDATLGVDFTAFSEGDFNVYCLDGPPTPVAPQTWGRIKSLYQDR